MPDDERTRRRLSDETKGRIADLASGWTVDPPVPASVPTSPPEPRSKPKTAPPPTPGSDTRKAVDSAGPNAAKDDKPTPAATPASAPLPAVPAPARLKPPTAPPPAAPAAAASGPPPPPATSAEPVRAKGPTTPPPLPRAKGATQPPPVPPAGRAKASQPPPVAVTVESVPPERDTIADLSDAVEEAGKRTPVPVGEFEDGASTRLDADKLRVAHAQATIKRDAANAVLGIAEPALTQVKGTPVEVLLTETAEALRGDPTMTDPATAQFVRGDPTQLGRGDPTAATSPSAAVHTKGGRLRTVAQLRRQRGVYGDVRYVATALFGVRRARAELAELDAKQIARQQGRRRYLVTLGRTAVSSDGFDHPALAAAREQLASIEDERSHHHAQVGAADRELQRVTTDREAAKKQHATDLAAIDAELAELAKRLEPLHKEQAQLTRKAADLREAQRRADAAIAEATANLVSVKSSKKDPATLQAELATLKADRIAVQKDEPVLAAELDALNPKIAALEAKRVEATTRRSELLEAEQNDQRRTEELLAAIGAKRKVMDRAASDAETVRDKILFELGERLYVDRPDGLAAQMAPIDAIDVELGVADRRLMELREILSSIDRWKLARGIAVLVLVLGAVAAGIVWLVSVA
ncbi:MAG: hypothetical protein SFX73_36710 [Kofleriaceae bacterium]|nr:hypothetical protein [Kofleriaceae bacterium]